MKILFIENRYKTFWWELIAKELENRGHEVCFLIQNKRFKPNIGNCYIMPYPKKFEFKNKVRFDLDKVIKSNRGLNFFGIKNDYFIYYYHEIIDDFIENYNPDIVFGEATNFHELITISACKKRNILYLNPSTCRYPSERFSFYLYDSLEPYFKSGEFLNSEAATNIIESITQKKSIPDYMKNIKYALSKKEIIIDRLNLVLDYYKGEKFNTPSPLRFLKLKFNLKKNLNEWKKISIKVNELNKSSFLILYPLQMQPEANIDVWGHKNSNQLEVLKSIKNKLKEGEFLIIKLNPKSKYEVSTKLIDFIKKNRGKVIAISEESTMTKLWPLANLIITVTGTVSIECVLDNKPVIGLGKGIQMKEKNCFNSLKELRQVINLIKTNNYPIINKTEKVEFLNKIVATSFKGVNGDGLHNRKYIKDFQKPFKSYLKVLDHLQNNLLNKSNEN